LRHYFICQRLSEGADIYQIAKNCRTSVEMIEKFYASHLANTLNAAAINVCAQAEEGRGRQEREETEAIGGNRPGFSGPVCRWPLAPRVAITGFSAGVAKLVDATDLNH
jgi:hypothetical protein